jgi:hypothetical protein
VPAAQARGVGIESAPGPGALRGGLQAIARRQEIAVGLNSMARGHSFGLGTFPQRATHWTFLPGGQSFPMNPPLEDATSSPITAVTNWTWQRNTRLHFILSQLN